MLNDSLMMGSTVYYNEKLWTVGFSYCVLYDQDIRCMIKNKAEKYEETERDTERHTERRKLADVIHCTCKQLSPIN